MINLLVADGGGDEIIQNVNISSVAKPCSRYYRILVTNRLIYCKILALKPDVVHLHDPELLLLGPKLAKKNYTVIYDAHEDLPKQILSKYWLSKLLRPLTAKIAQGIEKYCAARIYAIVTATPTIAKRFIQYNPRTISICNYPQLTALSSANTKLSTAYVERSDSLCYIGSIAITRGIIPLVNSLAISRLPLKLAGKFSGDISLSQIKQLPGGEYVEYLGVLSQQEISQLLNQVKIGIVTLLPTPSYVESLPIKLFEYMLAGIPVVASNFPLWCEIVLKYECGVVIDPEDYQAIAQVCNRLMHDTQYAQKLGINGRDAVYKHFNWQSEEAKLANLYQDFTV